MERWDREAFKSMARNRKVLSYDHKLKRKTGTSSPISPSDKYQMRDQGTCPISLLMTEQEESKSSLSDPCWKPHEAACKMLS